MWFPKLISLLASLVCFTGDRQPVLVTLVTHQLRAPESRPCAPLITGYCVLLRGSVDLATADPFTDGDLCQ